MTLTFPDFIWGLAAALASALSLGATAWAKATNDKVSSTSEKVIALETKLEFIMLSLERIEKKLDGE